LQQLRAKYQKKNLLLRGLFQDSFLRYDLSGALKNTGQVGSWTTSFVYIRSLEINSDAVQIKGLRVAQVFDPKERRFAAVRSNLDVVIRIEKDFSEPSSEKQFETALAKVFVDPQESLAPVVPDYWHWVVTHYKYDGQRDPTSGPTPDPPPATSGAIAAPSLERLVREGGNVKAPAGVRTSEPAYNELGRSLSVQGTSVVWLIVDEKGNPQRVRVGRPLGAGLDEQALDAVMKWKFQPATKDGKAIAVQIAVEVNFRLR